MAQGAERPGYFSDKCQFADAGRWGSLHGYQLAVGED